MSGPELGNALVFNQAQSKFLVVETYGRWVTAESMCRRLEKEVAMLKRQEGMGTEVRRKIASLNASIEKLQNQVVETKELSKTSQASALATFEARHKAVQDLEVASFKLEETESKLTEIEGIWRDERNEMQKAYDQILADHVKLENEKDELVRSRDKILRAHQDVLAHTSEGIARYDRETTELYRLVSELLLTKQWLLTEGAQSMVRLVHKSPELENIVADITNSVNAYG